MRSILTVAGLALALGLAAPPSSAALPPGISGAWYNPVQSGHGLSIEILDQQRAVLFWYVYDQDGDPIHLYIEGALPAGSHRIEGRAYLSRGMRFGSFDRNEHTLTEWGEVDIAFDSCTRASLQWNANGPAGNGYGSGGMELQRLTAIAGMPCDLDVSEALPAGIYHGTLSRGGLVHPLYGLLTRDGRWFAVAGDDLGWNGPPSVATLRQGAVLTGLVSSQLPGTTLVDAAFRSNDWLRDWTTTSAHANPPSWEPAAAPMSIQFDAGGGATTHATARIASVQYEAALSRVGDAAGGLADAAGSYAFSLLAPFVGPFGAELQVDASGSMCINGAFAELQDQPCAFEGQLFPMAEGEMSFRITHASRADIAYEGVAWLDEAYGEPALVLVGEDGDHGFGLVAHRTNAAVED